MSDELKPCPFCEPDEDRIWAGNNHAAGFVNCEKHTQVMPVSVWNSRPEETRLQERIDDLEKDFDASTCIIKEMREVFVGLEDHADFSRSIKSIDEYLSGKDKYSGVFEEKKQLEDRIHELENNVMAFASQLQAWELDTAADEVIKEILGGNVNAPDYYALKNRIDDLESALRHIYGYMASWSDDEPDNIHVAAVLSKAKEALDNKIGSEEILANDNG